jgi:hypothetical protein
MRSIRGFVLLVFLSAAPVLHADVTVRYKTDFKLGSFLPAAAQQQISSQKLPFPPVMVVQIKGDKGYSTAGLAASLLDFTKQQITVLDSTHKLFATVYMKDFPGEIGAAMPTMPSIPPAAQKILESIKSNFSVRKTGRTDMILGVQVEESELTLTIQMPVPADLPLPPGMFQPGEIVTVMKMVMQIWSATPAELARVPALGELGAHMSATRLMNPAAWLQQMLGRLPGFVEGATPMLDYFSKSNSPTLKSHGEIYIPVMARIAQLQQAQGQKPPAGLDADAPLLEINSEATELSDAALDDSIFVVPADYQSTTLTDLFKTLMPVASTPKPPTANVPGAPKGAGSHR